MVLKSIQSTLGTQYQTINWNVVYFDICLELLNVVAGHAYAFVFTTRNDLTQAMHEWMLQKDTRQDKRHCKTNRA